MIWNTIYGRQELVQTLQGAIEAEQIAHAYLFYGPVGIGKKTIAQVLATALNCTGAARNGCGTCESCRKAQNGTHPDLHWLRPEGKSLKIEQIRQLKKNAYLKPREGNYQIFILEQADALTAEAANSLLKVLEEPPRGSLFILLAEHPSMLPATVVSRCQLFVVPRLNQANIARLLQQYDLPAAEVAEIADWAEGIPGRALAMSNQTTWRTQYTAAIDTLAALAAAGTVSQLAAKLEKLEELTTFLDAMTLVLREVLLWQTVGVLAKQEQQQQISQLAETWSVHACIAALDEMLLLQQSLQSPVNKRLALEKMLRSLKEVRNIDANSSRNSF
ncbi:MAG TPA: DNA polymerase III subunit delta' [Oscillospiraceae bacterium]|nr:DNA polymerase III subunit delta' [Oscillospiraceae bacterium]